MAAVQAADVRASFLFVGDLNGHHQEWLGSTTRNRHGVAAFDFATVSGCDQLAVCPTHSHGGTLDLLMTDVPDLVRVAAVAPIFSWNINSIEILYAVQYGICPFLTVDLLTILLRFWTNNCPCQLDVMYQPKPSECVTRISLGLMINEGMLLALSRRLIFGGRVIALWLTRRTLSAVKWELMKPTQRPSVSVVTETGMSLWISSPLIIGPPKWSSPLTSPIHSSVCGVRLEFVIASACWWGWWTGVWVGW